MTPFKTPEGPDVFVDLASVVICAPIKFQTPGPNGQPLPALGAPEGTALLFQGGAQAVVVGKAADIAKQVQRAKGSISVLSAATN